MTDYIHGRLYVYDATSETFDLLASKRSPNFGDLRYANVQRNKEWDPDNKLTLTFSALELAGEVGEFSNMIKKLERERLGIPGSRVSLIQVAKEAADIQICLDLVMMRLNLDLGQATRDKFNATSEKMNFKTRL